MPVVFVAAFTAFQLRSPITLALRLARGGPGYQGKDTCISFDAINAAFDKAASEFGLRHKVVDVDVEEVGQLGMALTYVAETIARM